MKDNQLTEDELKQLIDCIVYFQLGARTKGLRTIKVKLKNQLKEKQNDQEEN